MQQKLVFGATLLLLAITSLSPLLYGQRAERNGEISQLDEQNQSFTVRTSRGETNVLTSESTVFKDGQVDISFADLKVGDQVQVIGTRQGSDVIANSVTRKSL